MISHSSPGRSTQFIHTQYETLRPQIANCHQVSPLPELFVFRHFRLARGEQEQPLSHRVCRVESLHFDIDIVRRIKTEFS